ncbi:MAG: hypothetical protein COA39_011295 [Sulfurimonas sp.]|nr:hypothetical protein [Sulfurimonas sp.]
MNIPILFSNRFIKIFANILKAFSYIFHFIFPKKRFKIPLHAKPLLKSKQSYTIPKIIWQTNYTNIVTLPVYLNYLCNRLFSLDYEYNYVGTEARDAFLQENASAELYQAFSKLTDGAAQADVWRLFILNHTGGIYMDIDAHIVWPLSKIIKPTDRELFLRAKRGHINNYFIASAPHNPILSDALEMILNNIQKKKIDGGVFEMTGPTVLNQAIADKEITSRLYKYTAIQGSFTNEYFQYMDKPRGKWTHAKNADLLKD